MNYKEIRTIKIVDKKIDIKYEYKWEIRIKKTIKRGKRECREIFQIIIENRKWG